jgi:glycosyltransferase involved in cell wall biosynthesis
VSSDGPAVSFVVPCYRLAHYLEECVASILAQRFRDIEVIILDDASPDETPAVARRILDGDSSGRVSYRRNEVNLGNIRTYNLGIRTARGRYVWILSPDDRLRDPEIVSRYVQTLDADPDIGFAFCAGHGIEGDLDVGVREWSRYATRDVVLSGDTLPRGIISNTREILAPSVMIRKSCYERISMFPEDLPHRGDSYVWCSIAMRHKVAFFADAMVDYREHPGSMMTILAQGKPQAMMADDVGVLWRLREEAARLGRPRLERYCYKWLLIIYARCLAGYSMRGAMLRMTADDFAASLRQHEPRRWRRVSFRMEVRAVVMLRAVSRTLRAARRIQATRLAREGSSAS